jgi:predicted SprT family Zn-dependent metalloprotease
MNLKSAQKFLNDQFEKDFTIKCQKINLKEKGWSFSGFDSAVRRAGVCRGGRKVIGLSKLMSQVRSDDEVKNTILHEVAHALDFAIRGRSAHDAVWKSIAKEIGCDGKRCYETNEEIKTQVYKYVAVCPIHGVIGGWTRKPKMNGVRRCKTCGSPITIE